MIDRHVRVGWDKSHFLSFSASERTAFRFGMHCAVDQFDQEIDKCILCDENSNDWEFAIITIDTGKISWNRLENGVYEGFYPPSLTKFAGFSNYRVVLIDVVRVLEDTDLYCHSLDNAKTDEEWLILPATLVPFDNAVEYSAILDGNSILQIRRYKR